MHQKMLVSEENDETEITRLCFRCDLTNGIKYQSIVLYTLYISGWIFSRVIVLPYETLLTFPIISINCLQFQHESK